MGNFKTMESYLVALGFSVDSVGYSKFAAALRDASSLVQNQTSGIVKYMLGAQTAITGGFAAAGASALGIVDKVAMADQQYRMLALHMYTTTGVARELKMATDALGQPLENIIWDPELSSRFQHLIEIQRAMTNQLGSSFETQMVRIRDLRAEFSYFGVELKYLTMKVVSDFGKVLGIDIDQLLVKMQDFNKWFVNNLPWITKWLESKLKPAMVDIRSVLSETWDLLKLGAVDFQNLIGLLSGDKSIEGTAASFDKMATAIQRCMGWITDFTKAVIHAQEIFLHLVNAGLLAAAGKFTDALAELKAASGLITTGSTALVGAALGGAVGAVTPIPGGMVGGAALGGSLAGGAASLYGTFKHGGWTELKAALVAQNARTLAIDAGMRLGIQPDLIYRQWQEETANFTAINAASNLAGIKRQGKLVDFQTLKDFEDYYVGILSGSRYAGLQKPSNVQDWAKYLAKGHYYTHGKDLPATPEEMFNYAAGMGRYGGMETRPVIINHNNFDIDITHPGESGQQIGDAIVKKLKEHQDKQSQRVQADALSTFWASGGQ